MGRWLFNAFALFSLLICLASGTIWTISEFAAGMLVKARYDPVLSQYKYLDVMWFNGRVMVVGETIYPWQSSSFMHSDWTYGSLTGISARLVDQMGGGKWVWFSH